MSTTRTGRGGSRTRGQNVTTPAAAAAAANLRGRVKTSLRSLNDARGGIKRNRNGAQGVGSGAGAEPGVQSLSQPSLSRGRDASPMTTAAASRTPQRTFEKIAMPAQSQGGSGASYQDRFQALRTQREKERIDAIARGFLADPDKPRTLAEAITPVGTCPDMCAEFERVERVVQKDVWGPETDPNNDQGLPDEQRMVKKFRRAAAGLDEQLPSDLRPPIVLKQTIDYLFNRVIANAESLGSVHHFVWDRTRAIRNDFSIQQITKPADVEIAIDCYERIARFHILSLHQLAQPEKPYDKYDWYQEREQLDRTLLSLMQYYDDSKGRVTCRNEPEFRAYLILFQIQDPTPDLEERVGTWGQHTTSQPRVRRALELYATACNILDPQGPLKPRAIHPIAQEDWRRFFNIIRSKRVSYLMACVAEIYFNLIRRTALNAILQAFKPQNTKTEIFDFTIELVTDILGFDDWDQTEDFCQQYGFVFKQPELSSEDEPFLDLNSIQGKVLPAAGQTLAHQTFSEQLVESKRAGRTLPAVINGYTVSQAQNEGLLETLDGNDALMEEDSSADIDVEDEDSLFVPQVPSRTSFPAVSAAAQQSAASPFSPFAAKPNVQQAGPQQSAFSQQPTSAFNFGQPSTSTASVDSASTSKNPFAPKAAQSPFAVNSNSTFSAGSTAQNKPNPNPFSGFGQPSTATSSFGKPSDPTPHAPATTHSIFATPNPGLSDGLKAPLPKTNPVPAFGGNLFTPTGTASSTAPPVSQAGAFEFSTPSSESSAPQKLGFPSLVPNTKVQITATPTAANSEQSSSIFSSKKPTVNGGFSFGQAPSTESSPERSSSRSELAKPAAQASSLPQFTFTSPESSVSATPGSQASFSADPAKPDNLVNSNNPSSASLFAPKVQAARPNRPKNPSPLFKSFSIPDAEGHPADATPEQSLTSLTPAAINTANDTANKQTITKPQQPVPTTDIVSKKLNREDILQRLANEVIIDVNSGLIRQFVEYHARQVVMSVYEELYIESLNEQADNFRKETLSYRYGKLWREICWRRKLARQGREKRKRTKKDQHAREVKQKVAAQADVVEDFLRSTRAQRFGQSRSSSSNLQSEVKSPTMTNPYRKANVDAVMSMDTPKPRRPQSSRTKSSLGLNSVTNGTATNQADKSPAPGRATPARTSNQQRTLQISTPTLQDGRNEPNTGRNTVERSNYFRLKALGINPSGNATPSLSRKRLRASGDFSASDASPPAKKSRTPPRSITSIDSEAPLHLTYPDRAPSVSAASSIVSMAMSEARHEDDALLARARAARRAMADTASWYRSETEKAMSAGPPEMPALLQSSSMERARQLARRRASQDPHTTSSADVPAYRLRESRFVPRENYGKAIVRPRKPIEADTQVIGSPQVDDQIADRAAAVSSVFKNSPAARPATQETPQTSEPVMPSMEPDTVSEVYTQTQDQPTQDAPSWNDSATQPLTIASRQDEDEDTLQRQLIKRFEQDTQNLSAADDQQNTDRGNDIGSNFGQFAALADMQDDQAWNYEQSIPEDPLIDPSLANGTDFGVPDSMPPNPYYVEPNTHHISQDQEELILDGNGTPFEADFVNTRSPVVESLMQQAQYADTTLESETSDAVNGMVDPVEADFVDAGSADEEQFQPQHFQLQRHAGLQSHCETDEDEVVEQADGEQPMYHDGQRNDSMRGLEAFDEDAEDYDEEDEEDEEGYGGEEELEGYERAEGDEDIEDEEEDYDEDDEEDEEESEEGGDIRYPQLPRPFSGTPDAASVIKAGTGTAEDAFELSD